MIFFFLHFYPQQSGKINSIPLKNGQSEFSHCAQKTGKVRNDRVHSHTVINNSHEASLPSSPYTTSHSHMKDSTPSKKAIGLKIYFATAAASLTFTFVKKNIEYSTRVTIIPKESNIHKIVLCDLPGRSIERGTQRKTEREIRAKKEWERKREKKGNVDNFERPPAQRWLGPTFGNTKLPVGGNGASEKERKVEGGEREKKNREVDTPSSGGTTVGAGAGARSLSCYRTPFLCGARVNKWKADSWGEIFRDTAVPDRPVFCNESEISALL